MLSFLGRLRIGVERPVVSESELQHRCSDFRDSLIGDRSGGGLECKELCSGNLPDEGFAIADREERVASTVHHQRGQ